MISDSQLQEAKKLTERHKVLKWQSYMNPIKFVWHLVLLLTYPDTVLIIGLLSVSKSCPHCLVQHFYNVLDEDVASALTKFWSNVEPERESRGYVR